MQVGIVRSAWEDWPWWIRANGWDDGSDVPRCPGPINEQRAGAPHRGSPLTGDVSEGMVPDARVVAKASTLDGASTSEREPPQLGVGVRDLLVPNAFGRRFPWTAGHGPRCARR